MIGLNHISVIGTNMYQSMVMNKQITYETWSSPGLCVRDTYSLFILIISNKPSKLIQDHINFDLKNLCEWLRANLISLNASKTELLFFRHPNKNRNFDFKLKMNERNFIHQNLSNIWLC